MLKLFWKKLTLFKANRVLKQAQLSIFLILGAGFCYSGCTVTTGTRAGAGEKPGFFTAAVWNVQTLFDGEGTGNEYTEYRSSAGWNHEKYEARLLSISRAIGGMTEKGGPDLIGIIEVENSKILKNLAEGPLAKSGYSYTFFGALPGSSLGLGVLSRYPFIEARLHSLTDGKTTIPRPVLEVKIEAEGRPLIFFICHWKSKLGGDDLTERVRRSSAKVLQRRLRELQEEEPGTPAIIMGDLNENYDEFYRQGGAVISALLPDDPTAAALASALSIGDCLIVSGEKPPAARYFNDSQAAFYSPWGKELQTGSYWYNNSWETIDHFLLGPELFNGTDWEFEGCEVLASPPFTGPQGYPQPYMPRNGGGLSDHLPLLLTLKRH
ncbi:MAG: endonuclease/exonuclease/phosphatase family protein [Treponema sp.]|jgi:endonuclease/exonuclease/phosphatase family metal-dependent hydrolase|nr:endonuclease/exonuclease/phosphatase family protein [Treponema sp.]